MDYGLDKPVVTVHSHPDVIPTTKKELESMGDWNGKPWYLSDWYNVMNDVSQNGRITRLSYVYFQNTANLYFVGYHNVKYIRKVDNYKRFYFGTLNDR